MKKAWSISTTVRNPYRIRDFLMIAKQFKGKIWNKNLAVNYQVKLIENKFYKPTSLTETLKDKYESTEYFTPSEAKKSFDLMMDKSDFLKKQPAIRGSMSLRLLEKLGFVIKHNNKLLISKTGDLFLQDNFDLGEIFLRVLLKWQYPNLISKWFSEKEGYSIKPFVATLHIINQVNQQWKALGNKPYGITKEEFSIFVQTLINHKEITDRAKKIIDFRKQIKKCQTKEEEKREKDTYKVKFIKEILNTTDSKRINRFLATLKDYSDNAIRYFRLTGYIYIRGGGFCIDLEPRRCIEIERLLKTDDGAALKFKNINEYQAYIGDINTPILPWETELELNKIVIHTKKDIDNYEKRLKNKNIIVPVFKAQSIKGLNKIKLKNYITQLRKYRHKLQVIETHYESQDLNRIREYISLIKNIHKYDKGQRSVELERLISLALNALNDALEIKPNYPVGDDNNPTFTAPAGKPDIECFYKKFNSICEVTMLTDRSQWYNEGQPVMRHLRDFEIENKGSKIYCLFVAPRLHRDTINTFWFAIKYGYEGEKQKIIPLSISQFVQLLETLLKIREKGRKFKHTELLRLYEGIVGLSKSVNKPDIWLKKFSVILNTWSESLLSRN